MDAIEFNKLPKLSNKIDTVQHLSASEIKSLIDSQKKTALQQWNGCLTETTRKFLLEPTDTEKRVLYHDYIVSQACWALEKFSYKQKCKPCQLSQWDIFNCDLGVNIGCEQNKTRPVVVVQKMINYGSATTVIIAPITTTEKKNYRHEIELPATQTHRGIHGVIDLSQIRTVSNLRLSSGRIDSIKSNEEYKAFCLMSGIDYSEENTVQFKIKRELARLFGILVSASK